MPRIRRRVSPAPAPVVVPDAPPPTLASGQPVQAAETARSTLLSPAASDPPSVRGETLAPAGCRPDALDFLCEQTALGRPLDDILTEPHMPPKGWLVRALSRDDALRDRYFEAFDLSVCLEADRLLPIADNDREDPQRSKVRLDTRKWLLERRDPRRFSTKVELEHNVTGDLLALFKEASNRGHAPPGAAQPAEDNP